MLEPGRIVDRYEVEEELGAGGVATVYRVRHTALGSLHALKVLQLGGRNIRQRLIEEGQAQARLRHPNIVRVNDVIDVDGNPGLIMEYIQGPPLDRWLRHTQPEPEVAEHLFRGILAGVTRAHRFGLVHRDLKPGNVLLEPGEDGLVPKVADFGLAKALSDDEPTGRAATRSGVAMGTPAYMAPEQVRDSKNVDQRADIFALGCILYELYCGVSPFDGPDVLTIFSKLAAGTYRPPEEANPDIPVRIRNAIVGCLSNDREQRIPDCATLRTVLDGGTYTPLPTLAPPGRTSAEILNPTLSFPSGAPRNPASRSDTFALAAEVNSDGSAVLSAGPATGAALGAGPLPTVPHPRATGVEIDPAPGLGASIVPRAETHTSFDRPAPDPFAEPPPPRRSGLGLAAIAAIVGFGAVMLAVVAGAAGWYFSQRVAAGDPDPVAAVAPPAGEAAPSDLADPTAQPGEAAAPALEPDEAVAAAQPPPDAQADSPSDAPTEAPATPRVTASTAGATRVGSPSTATSRPAAEPPPAPAEAATGTVAVTGTVDRVVLDGPGGRHPPGPLAPGRYSVLATFGDNTVATGAVTVTAGKTVTLACNAEFLICKAR